MSDINITIESEEKPLEDTAEETTSAETIAEETDEEMEIDDKWLNSKFDAVENRSQEILVKISTLAESMLTVSQIPEMARMISELSARLMNQAIVTAEALEETTSTPPASTEEVPEPSTAEINPANEGDLPEVEIRLEEKTARTKRKAI